MQNDKTLFPEVQLTGASLDGQQRLDLLQPGEAAYHEPVVIARLTRDVVQLVHVDHAADADGEQMEALGSGLLRLVGCDDRVVGEAVRQHDDDLRDVGPRTCRRREAVLSHEPTSGQPDSLP